MSVKTITKEIALEIDSCCVCGIVHAIPKELRDHCYNNGGRWYCPNGHHIGWSEAHSKKASDQMREEVARLKSKVSLKDERIESLNRSLSAQQGQITKIKNRIANGVCPCCNRSFANLARHITVKHPNYKNEVIN